MGVITPNTIFFHLPRTGGTWVTRSLEEAFGEQAIKLNVDAGWPLPENGIHVPPTRIVSPEKFTFTFVRHPWDWYVSFFQLGLPEEKTWGEFVDNYLGKYTELVKQFEQVDFVGTTENLYFDLCNALELAGEDFDVGRFLPGHVNRSDSRNITTRKKDIMEAESYVIDKYYS